MVFKFVLIFTILILNSYLKACDTYYMYDQLCFI